MYDTFPIYNRNKYQAGVVQPLHFAVEGTEDLPKVTRE